MKLLNTRGTAAGALVFFAGGAMLATPALAADPKLPASMV
jgi:hypothetical protein